MEPIDAALVERYRPRPSWKRYARLVLLAASAGNDLARYIQATWLLRGFAKAGIRKDVPAAIPLLKRASRSSLHAMVELARCYEDGIGVPRDLARARRLLVKACRFGSVVARIHLAWIHGEGVGVRADPRKARRLMREAAQLGLTIDERDELVESSVLEAPSPPAKPARTRAVTRAAPRRRRRSRP